MRTSHPLELTQLDYRDSHRHSGPAYDEGLSLPLDLYMDRWEVHHLLNVVGELFQNRIPRYLDFACGTGRITKRIEPLAIESYGIDVSESMLSVARQKCLNTKFVNADITRKDIEIGRFDLVTAFRFFGNAQDELRELAMSGIRKLLNPNGYLIFNNHRNPTSLLRKGKLFAARSPNDILPHSKLKALLLQNGFRLVDQRPIGFWIYRFKLLRDGFLSSRFADQLERAFHLSFFAPFSPDAVFVTQKISDES